LTGITRRLAGMAFDGRHFGGIDQKTQQFALGQFDHDAMAAARIAADAGRGVEAARGGGLRHLRQTFV
jgi:hypothetical protein